jgi:hypothetical protein
MARAMQLDSPQPLEPTPPPCGTNDIYTVWMTNIVCASNSDSGWTFSFTIAGGTNGAVYDVFSAPALAGNSLADAQWTWVTNGHACDTIVLTNQPGFSMFYVLGTPLDRDGDGLTDAFEALVSKSDPTLWSTRGDGISDLTAWFQGRNPRVGGSMPDNGSIGLEVYTPLR